MKALTILQPYATALATGMKKYETRPRRTHHRGPMAIHAGKAFMQDGFNTVTHLDWMSNLVRPIARKYAAVEPTDFISGAIIAVADVVDCHEMTEEFIMAQTPQEIALGNWEVGRYAYELANVVILPKPIFIGGQQGMWTVDDSLF